MIKIMKLLTAIIIYSSNFLCGITILISCSISSCAEISKKEFIIKEDSSIYREIIPLAILWKEAILNKDFDALLRNVLPENSEYDRKSLSNKDSNLYRSLYDTNFVKRTNVEGKSVYEFLKTAKRLKIVLIGEQPISVFGIAAYYYDEAKSELVFPLSDKHKKELWLSEYVICGFLNIDNEWKLSFEHQFEDEEGNGDGD